MTTRVQKGITAGVALVGAGVMAAAPVAQQAPEVLRSAEADVAARGSVDRGTRGKPCAVGTADRHRVGRARLSASPPLQSHSHRARTRRAAAILKEVVDGPQWAADPAIYALDDLLPAPIGGSPGNVQETARHQPDHTVPRRSAHRRTR